MSGRTRAGIAGALAALAAAALVQVAVWTAPAVEAAEPGDDPTTCTRDIEYRGLLIEWTFDPCIPDGTPLPADVEDAMYEDWVQDQCQPPPTGEPPPTGQPAAISPTATGIPGPTATASPPCPTPTATAEPTEPPPSDPPPSDPPPPEPSETPSETPTASPVPEPCPDDTAPSPTGAFRVEDEDQDKLTDARRDRFCPPGRNPSSPVVVVATGDSVTSAHLQRTYAYPLGNCAGNTAQDVRGLPGNDMRISYVGKYVDNINRNVVEYYNFARTGMGTREILTAARGYRDTCRNQWARGFPPADLAERAIRKAKADGKAAYFVTTGGVNNTNWTDVLAGIASCGTMDHYRGLIQQYINRNRLPWTASMRWYDAGGTRTTKDKVINGGACHGRITGNFTGVRYIHRRINIPAYDGPARFAQIRADVTTITTKMLNAGADKIVWMGYYDISPAKFNVGLFAETYRQALSRRIRGYLPGRIPSHEVDLIDDPAWKLTVQQWTRDLNAHILRMIPVGGKMKFQAPPALDATKIQKTILGGCPHPNDPGHTDLSNRLDAAFQAI